MKVLHKTFETFRTTDFDYGKYFSENNKNYIIILKTVIFAFITLLKI